MAVEGSDGTGPAATSKLQPGSGPFTWLSLALALLAGAPAPTSGQDEAVDVEFALRKPLATESLLLDGASAGDLLIAVGVRGHILRSRDRGATWEQAESVPTRAMLTAVHLHDEQLGWSVGHDATVLRTTDGGANWEVLYSAPDEELPLLDVWFEDEQNGVAIGAYGYFLETYDGGDSWSPVELAAATPEDEVEEDPFAYDEGGDYHLNHIARSEGDYMYIAAEAGTIYRSEDRGQSWTTLPSPYEGSFFGSLPLEGSALLVFGLRGNLFRSDDAGETWEELDSGTQAILNDGLVLNDGTVVIVGLEGTILVSSDGGRTFELRSQPDRQGYSSVLEAADGGLMIFGEFGVTLLPRSALTATGAGSEGS